MYYYTKNSLLCCIIFCSIFATNSSASDTITSTQSLTSDQTLVSAGGVFELGFFNPGNSKWYIGIWYNQIPERTVVWVANRDNPLTNLSLGVLQIDSSNNIVLSVNSSKTYWSSNQTTSVATVAQLLDSGNFVLRPVNDQNPDNYIWQSFDYPTDTLLPGMKLGWDSGSGLNRYLKSWRSDSDPSLGDFVFKLDIFGFPEAIMTDKNDTVYRSGPWNGLRFSGVPEMKGVKEINFEFVNNKTDVYYSFSIVNKSLLSRLIINPFGDLQRYTWVDSAKQWTLYWYAPEGQCDDYQECGPYGVCDDNQSPVCSCMKGFEPKNPQAWSLRDMSEGCIRKTNLDCWTDGFLALNNMKLPDSSNVFVDKSMSLDQCEEMCRKKCSCTAYSNFDITGSGSGCVMWAVDLLDMRQYATSGGGQDLYVRLAAADLGNGGAGDSSKRKLVIKMLSIVITILVVISGLMLFYALRRKPMQIKMFERTGTRERSQDLCFHDLIILSRRHSIESTTDELELPIFDFGTLAMATNKFSDENKLGQGGFGSVYKGTLVDGQDIAVKRLSQTSCQGTDEFKNEVKLIARLQHRNLVRLLGCCTEMEEKLLVYEYMENKSLDSILFTKEKRSLLNWQRRFNIICGIARGLLYLHQDSRFRIIHRDLKASNILLDKDMNPKISDFGMARIFGSDQIEENTMKVVGTYGYMAPEYAMDGLFSLKSDIFSFGVLILEIVSGMRNRGFYINANQQLNLHGYAWRLWREGRGLELFDKSAGVAFSHDEVLRCIQVGLLCVQENAGDRPAMSTVLLMLSTENTILPTPKYPGYCLGKRPVDNYSSSGRQDKSCSGKHLTVTVMDGR